MTEVDTSGTVDVQVAFAGMPFTEVEEPEPDWVEWVDQLAEGACWKLDRPLKLL